MAASAMSKGFFEFVKSIGEAKSKQEEDRIIEGELVVLKSKMAGRNVASRQMREYLIRMVYVEMLGHDASFGHIHAVKLTRARKLVDKRVGYLACALCLHKDHELMLLLVGGLQTDLQSQNQLEVSTALIVACKLIHEDTIPAILPLVSKLLAHAEASIRKKAIMTLQRFYELSPNSVSDIADKARGMLCDKDPSVMGSSLHLLFDLIVEDANSFKLLTSSFVSILKQIIEHRLPKDYDYHRMPAPWIQIKLLQILSMLGTADKQASEGMYEVLHEVMRRADIGINVGYAIIYECVRTVTTIYPNTQLLAEAAKCTSRFITSENHNLKYLGINALASIVQVNPAAANEHQMVVIDCLEDRDETLRRKTLDLLYRMTNENNVSVICTKLISSLKDSVDTFLRTELIEKITSLAEKFAPDTIWFIETMSDVFELGGSLVKEQIAHNFIKAMSVGLESDEDAEEDIAQYAADFFLDQLDRPRVPNILLKVIAWVLGEYGHLATGQPMDAVMDQEEKQDYDVIGSMEVIRRLWDVVEKQSENSETRLWTMSATCKLCKQLNPVPNEVTKLISKYQKSVDSELQQLAHELMQMIHERQIMGEVFAESTITDDIDVDGRLSFLDSFVRETVDTGGRRYAPPDDIDDPLFDHKVPASGLLLEHQTTQADQQTTLTEKVVLSTPHITEPAEEEFAHPVVATRPEPESVTLRVQSKARRWGPSGYNDPSAPTEEPAQDNDYGHNIQPTVATYTSSSQKREYTPEETSPQPNASSRRPPPQRILSEKEKMAQALFTGIGADEVIGRGRASRRRMGRKRAAPKKKTQRVSQPSQSPPPQQPQSDQKTNDTGGDDLLDMDDLFSGGMEQKGNPTSNPVPTGMGGDLLDDLLSGGPAPVSNNVGKSAMSNDPLDFLGDLAAAPVANNGASMPASADDFLGSLSNPVSSDVQSASLSGARGFAALPQLKSKLGPFPRSSQSDEVLVSNAHLQLSYFRVFKQQQTALCLFVSNLSNAALTNVEVVVEPSNPMANVQIGFDVGNSIPKPKLNNARTAVIPSLNGNATACQIASFGAENPFALALPINLAIGVSYSLNNSRQSARAAIQINSSDIMRPCVLSTQDFGQTWVKLMRGEVKFGVQSGTDLTQYVATIEKLHLHHIQTIKVECIAAGQITASSNASNVVPILVHCKKEATGFTIMVRTASPNVSKAVAQQLQRAIS